MNINELNPLYAEVVSSLESIEQDTSKELNAIAFYVSSEQK